MLDAELQALAKNSSDAIDKEIERRVRFEEELEKEVDLPLKSVKAVNIKGKGKGLLSFLTAIQPVLVYDNTDIDSAKEAKKGNM